MERTMTVEEAITELQHEIQWAKADLYPYVSKQMVNACKMAIRSLEAWDAVDRQLKTIMEGDKRTFSNRETEDGLYYDGIYDAIKIIQEHLLEVENGNE